MQTNRVSKILDIITTVVASYMPSSNKSKYLPVVHLEEFLIKKLSVRVFLKEKYREHAFFIENLYSRYIPQCCRTLELTNFLTNAQRVKYLFISKQKYLYF
ncbi:MAG: hypothetical protein D8M18_09895 [Bacteroidetes bacterium]|nr:hypothetical protein [Bacteroidota bacterium]